MPPLGFPPGFGTSQRLKGAQRAHASSCRFGHHLKKALGPELLGPLCELQGMKLPSAEFNRRTAEIIANHIADSRYGGVNFLDIFVVGTPGGFVVYLQYELDGELNERILWNPASPSRNSVRQYTPLIVCNTRQRRG